LPSGDYSRHLCDFAVLLPFEIGGYFFNAGAENVALSPCHLGIILVIFATFATLRFSFPLKLGAIFFTAGAENAALSPCHLGIILVIFATFATLRFSFPLKLGAIFSPQVQRT